MAGSDRAPIGLCEQPIQRQPQNRDTSDHRFHLRISGELLCGALQWFHLEYSFQKPQVLSLRSNEILTAVIHGARKDEPSPEVQLAAIHALYNSLEFVRDNFEREVSRLSRCLCHWEVIFFSTPQGERNYIMQVICEATQNPSIPVQVGAFECLVRIMSLYYDKMALYMEQALFGVCVPL